MDEFERELREAMERRPAPPGLKRKVMERRWQQRSRQHRRMVWYERLAASVVLAAAVGGALAWHHAAEERRRGEEAKRQVFTALRIMNHALGKVNAQLGKQDRNKE